METIIKLKPEELNSTVFDYLKQLISKKDIKQITINLNDNVPAKSLRNESKAAVQKRIQGALKEIKKGNDNFISFNADEFDVYSQSLLSK